MAEEGATTTTTDTGAAASVAGTAADAGKADVASVDTGAAADTAKTEAAAREAEKQALLGDEKPKTETKVEPVDYDKALSEVQMPEGMTMDPVVAKAGKELFGQLDSKPTANDAKKLANFLAQQQKAGADGNAKAFADQVGGWKASAEKATTPEERGVAKETGLKIFGKEEMALLDTFGITNRASFIKALAKLAKDGAIKDDTFVPGNAGASNGSDDARKLYPKSNMNP